MTIQLYNIHRTGFVFVFSWLNLYYTCVQRDIRNYDAAPPDRMYFIFQAQRNERKARRKKIRKIYIKQCVHTTQINSICKLFQFGAFAYFIIKIYRENPRKSCRKCVWHGKFSFFFFATRLSLAVVNVVLYSRVLLSFCRSPRFH